MHIAKVKLTIGGKTFESGDRVLKAAAERQAALGDAQPPEGWHTAPLGNGGTR
jgi:hypothetical protein